MAKKGKKLWRKALDSQRVPDALEKKSREERQGLAVDHLSDAELFFVDKDQDQQTVAVLEKGVQLRQKKKETKLLRCQAIIQASHKALPVNAGATKRKRLAVNSKSLQVKTSKSAIESGGDTLQLPLGWDTDGPPESKRKKRAPSIKALQIDAAGCSFNPDENQHEEVVAEAVAAEMMKIYQQELEPKPNLVFQRMPNVNELEDLLGSEEEDDTDGNSEEIELGPQAEAVVHRPQEKKTQAARNRDKRRKQAEADLAIRRKLKKQRRDLQELQEIEREVAEEESLKSRKAARKAADKADKALTLPPKLGKHTFQPASIQVLLSEEIDGSLRRLKGAPMLAEERYKSLQQRGLVETRVPVQAPKRRKLKSFQTGDRIDRIHAEHKATMDIIKATAKMKQAQ